MSQKHLQKWRQHGQNSQNFVHFGQNDFVQISVVCNPNTYQIMYGENLDFQSQRQ